MAIKSLPLGGAYVIWTGVGGVGAFCVGVFVLGETATVHRVASVALIIVGMASLKLAST